MKKDTIQPVCLIMVCFLVAGCATLRAERVRNAAVLQEYEKDSKKKLLVSVDSAQDAGLRNIQCLLLIRTTVNSETQVDTAEDILPFTKILDLTPQLATLKQPVASARSVEKAAGESIENAIRITVGLSCRSRLEYKEIKRIDGIKGRILFEGREISTISPGLPYSLITIH